MTMVETIIILCVLATLIFVELFRTDPRALLYKPTDESPSFVEIFENKASPIKKGDSMLSLKWWNNFKKPVLKRVAVTAIDESSDPVGSEVNKKILAGRSYWAITDIKMRHSQLCDIIKVVK